MIEVVKFILILIVGGWLIHSALNPIKDGRHRVWNIYSKVLATSYVIYMFLVYYPYIRSAVIWLAT